MKYSRYNDWIVSLKMKVSGGALPLVIVVSLILGMLSASLITYVYFIRIHIIQLEIRNDLVANSNSGIQYLLANHRDMEYGIPVYVDLFGEGKDSVEITKSRWGLIDVGISRAHHASYQTVLSGYLGFFPDFRSKSALVLTDQRRPLSVAGNTNLKGDCFLPEAGIRTVTIGGVGYNKSVLVNGVIKESEEILPMHKFKDLDNLYEMPSATMDDLFTSDVEFDVSGTDTIKSSFLDPPLFLHNKGVMKINCSLKGHIAVKSDEKIIVGRNAKIEDILLLAPYIEFESGFKGHCQAFAKDSIKMEPGSFLKFPSVLCLVGNDELANNQIYSKIILDRNSRFEGTIMAPTNKLTLPFVDIKKRVQVMGQVYVDGYLQLSGEVFGNVMCKNFYLKTSSAFYTNHLLDATIDYNKLPYNYAGIGIFNDQNETVLLKWID